MKPEPNTLMNRIEHGLSHDEYIALMQKQVREKSAGEKQAYVDLNAHRTNRMLKTHKLSEALLSVVRGWDKPQTWLVLTEPWCGDSAWSLPIIARLAESNSRITLKILLRDDNPQVMELFLTDGKMSIPKFIGFDAAGEELFRWGPRPAHAMALYRSLVERGMPKEKLNEQLHLWYGRDRGRAIEAELLSLFTGLAR